MPWAERRARVAVGPNALPGNPRLSLNHEVYVMDARGEVK